MCKLNYKLWQNLVIKANIDRDLTDVLACDKNNDAAYYIYDQLQTKLKDGYKIKININIPDSIVSLAVNYNSTESKFKSFVDIPKDDVIIIWELK